MSGGSLETPGWIVEAIDAVTRGSEPEELASLASRITEALPRVGTAEDLREALAACSLLVRTAGLRGRLLNPDWGATLRRLADLRPPPSAAAVIGLGEVGHSLVSLLGREKESSLRRFFIDLESSRVRELDAEVVQVILESSPILDGAESPRYGELLHAAYRATSASGGLPALLSESLEAVASERLTVHVVVGIDDPWLMLIQDLLFDLRSFLGFGARGRCILHLVSPPLSRLRPAFRTALQDIERGRTFDDIFLVCANDTRLVERVAVFLRLSQQVPELLYRHSGAQDRGVLASYGAVKVDLPAPEDPEKYLSRLETGLRLAAPSWVPANPVLSEMAGERIFYIHPAQHALAEMAWKLCPELVPVLVEGVEPTLCRVQRGLRLEDLRFA